MTSTMHMDRADKNKVSTAETEDLRVIPVIFLPGIMGTNLKAKSSKKNAKAVWRYDSETSLLGWSLPSSGPIERKRVLHPERVDIDNRGSIPLSSGIQEQVSAIRPYPSSNYDEEGKKRYAEALDKVMENNEPEKKLFGSRRGRGWGEVAAASYGAFLDVLQTALYRDKPTKKDNTLSATYQKLIDEPLGLEYGPDSLDEECLEVMKLYQFPVHVVGYNWLGSNRLSAKRLSEEVDKIIKRYQEQKMKCHKVILVTHSMGGLVARYYSECLTEPGPGRDKIYGIVHGVMPSIGAAATYTRMKRGTENPESGAAGAVGYIISHVLGRNAAEMVAIGSQSSGALELLPANDYGDDWLKIVDRDGSTLTLPRDLPVKEGGNSEDCLYSGLYLNRDKWWKLMDENLLNPLITTPSKTQIDGDWQIYENLIKDNVKPFHEQMVNKYHPNTYSFYGKAQEGEIPEAHRTQETAIWSGALASSEMGEPPPEPKMNDDRLYLSEISADRTVKDELSPEEQAWKLKGDNGVMYGWVGQRFTLRDACENGDGTVPLRAGQIVHANIQERLAVPALHEAAYRHDVSQAFALRSIIKIAQQVNKDEKMAFI
ncbi:TPA: hypothetical protein HIE93_001461 [Escherichia coli]|nr:hypothetical protein [Escherichia coli]